MEHGNETKIEQEFCPTFHKQVSIKIKTFRIYDRGQTLLTTYNTYKCMADTSGAECLCCKLINR